MSNAILVVGGGFAGLTAAIEAAELGHDVYIVEKSPWLGGRVAQLNKYFPKLLSLIHISFPRRPVPVFHDDGAAPLDGVSGCGPQGAGQSSGRGKQKKYQG